MDFKGAVNLVRKDPDATTILYGIEISKSYIFVVSPHEEFNPRDPEAFMVSVDKNNGSVEKAKFFTDPEIYESIDNKEFIDISQEEFEAVM